MGKPDGSQHSDGAPRQRSRTCFHPSLKLPCWRPPKSRLCLRTKRFGITNCPVRFRSAQTATCSAASTFFAPFGLTCAHLAILRARSLMEGGGGGGADSANPQPPPTPSSASCVSSCVSPSAGAAPSAASTAASVQRRLFLARTSRSAASCATPTASTRVEARNQRIFRWARAITVRQVGRDLGRLSNGS